MDGFLYQALIYLTAAVVLVPIAKRLGLGSVLGYLLAGIAIGPFALGLVGEEGQDVLHFAEFGVVLMLFLIGLELEPSRVWRMRAPILGLGGLQVGVTTAALAGCGLAAGLEWRVSVAVGLTLALSSTAIVLQTLAEKGLLRTGGGQSAFAVLLFQDIAVIPILAVLPLLAPPGATPHGGDGHGETWVAGLPVWAETLVVLAAVLGIVLAGRYLLQPFFRFIARTGLRELFTAAALLLVIATATLMTKVGVSPALGTFLAGVVLARSEYRHELESDIEPFKGLLLGLFFIAVGAAIDFALIASRPGLIVGLMAALMALKLVVLLVLGRVFRMSLDQNLLYAVSLAQGGEFAFVLLSFATRYGVVDESLAATLIAVTALTMAATPVLMTLNEKLIRPRFGTREVEGRPADEIAEENPVIIAGFGDFGNVVGRLLLANGVGATVLDIDSDRVDLLRKLGLKVFYGDASRTDLLRAAGAEQAKLLVVALDSAEKGQELVATARRHFPHLTLLTRAPGRIAAYELIDSGVEHVFRDKLDSALRTGVQALRLLGFRGHQAHRAAQTFRRHDEEALRELAAMRHDHSLYINTARQRIQDLETMMRSDLEDEDGSRNAGWDTETLREEYGRAPDVGAGRDNDVGGRPPPARGRRPAADGMIVEGDFRADRSETPDTTTCGDRDRYPEGDQMIGRRVPFCLFALMVLPWGGPAYGHEGPNPCDCPDTLAPVFSPELVIAEVTAAEAALVVANNSGDPMAQFEHYADDYVYIDSGGKRITKAQLLERRQADERSPLTEASDFEVLPISADAAISRGRWDDRAVYYGGLPRVSSARYMALWRKRDGRWRLVADQGTPIVERQTIVRERLTLEDGTLGSFAGRYALDLQPPLAIELSVADGGLLLKIPGHLEDGVRFVPSGPSSFFAVERPWELAFDTAGGNIVLTTWGEETRGQRLSRPPGAR